MSVLWNADFNDHFQHDVHFVLKRTSNLSLKFLIVITHVSGLVEQTSFLFELFNLLE